ncbi:hypothetical protein A7982_12122 [Minicystis rosea]|nr:hypothetical protein A7982_12122 [Minicystis rosea]
MERMESAWPVAITALGRASAATVVWGRGGQRFVSVVLKATFAFVPDGPMVEVAPDPICAREEDGAPGLGLRAADDLAPYLTPTDVCLTGHAPPRLPMMQSVRVRFAVVRDGAALLDRVMDCEVSRAPNGAPLPTPIRGLGPISKRWPARRSLLGAIDPQRLEGTVIEIPDPFDWRYFQASSSDVRLGVLRGDEWLMLEGMHPTIERLMTQLPQARAFARLSGPSIVAAGDRPLDLTLDTLRIDVDRRCCALTFRRHVPIHGALEGASVVAGIELPGRPIAWPARPTEGARADDTLGRTLPVEDGDFVIAKAEEDPLMGTIGLGDVTLAELTARPIVPFAQAAALQAAPVIRVQDDPLGGTLGLREDVISALAARPATPFQKPGPLLSFPSQPSTLPVPAVARPVEHDPLGGTLGIDESAARVTSFPVIPFAEARESAPEPLPAIAADPLMGTMGIGEVDAAALIARAVTPFRADIASPLAQASSPFVAAPRAPHDPLGGTLGLDDALVADLLARPVIPFGPQIATKLSVPEARPGEGDDGPMPAGLGAQFLAAMAVLERRREA